MFAEMNALGWSGEELAWCKENAYDLYELYDWYEKDIDLCFMQGDMGEFRSTVAMYGKCLHNIWLTYNSKVNPQKIEDIYHIDRDNPWRKVDYNKAAVSDVQKRKQKRTKKDSLIYDNQLALDYFSSISAGHYE
jgi:hypothetical protein